jgi:hypothetical protein
MKLSFFLFGRKEILEGWPPFKPSGWGRGKHQLRFQQALKGEKPQTRILLPPDRGGQREKVTGAELDFEVGVKRRDG